MCPKAAQQGCASLIYLFPKLLLHSYSSFVKYTYSLPLAHNLISTFKTSNQLDRTPSYFPLSLHLSFLVFSIFSKFTHDIIDFLFSAWSFPSPYKHTVVFTLGGKKAYHHPMCSNPIVTTPFLCSPSQKKKKWRRILCTLNKNKVG